MAVTTTHVRQEFTGNGVATAFPFTFAVQRATDISVHYAPAGAPLAALTAGAFTVALNPTTPGGTVTFAPGGAPAALGARVVVLRTVVPTQGVSINNQDGFQPRVVTDALDRLAMVDQGILLRIDQSLRAPTAEPPLNPMASREERALRLSGFDTYGQPMTVQPPAGLGVAPLGAIVMPPSLPAQAITVPWVDPRWFEGSGAGSPDTADRSIPLQAAIDAAALQWGVGEVRIREGRWAIRDRDIQIKPGITLQGPYNLMGKRQAMDYSGEPGAIILNGARSIRVGRDAALRGLGINREGLFTPGGVRDLYALREGMIGTAVIMGSGPAGGHPDADGQPERWGDDSMVQSCAIRGFDKAIYARWADRGRINNVHIDCRNGVHGRECYDRLYTDHVHHWPFLTAHLPYSFYNMPIVSSAVMGGNRVFTFASAHLFETGDAVAISDGNSATGIQTVTRISSTQLRVNGDPYIVSPGVARGAGGTVEALVCHRAGTAFFSDYFTDWGSWAHCFAWGVNTGYIVTDASDNTFTSCGTDMHPGWGPINTIGYAASGAAYRNKLIAPQAAGHTTGLRVELNLGVSETLLHVVAPTMWGLRALSLALVSGAVTITGGGLSTATNIRTFGNLWRLDLNGVQLEGCDFLNDDISAGDMWERIALTNCIQNGYSRTKLRQSVLPLNCGTGEMAVDGNDGGKLKYRAGGVWRTLSYT